MDNHQDDKPFTKLARGSYFLLLSNITNSVIGALFWIVMAKLVSSTDIGNAMIVIALVTAIIGFTGNGISITLSKYVAEYRANQMYKAFMKLIRLGLILALVISTTIALVLSLLSDSIAFNIYNNNDISILIFIAALAYLPSQTIISALSGIYQGMHKTHYVTLTSAVFQGVRFVIALTLILFYSLNDIAIIVAFSVSSPISSLLAYIILLKEVKNEVRMEVNHDNIINNKKSNNRDNDNTNIKIKDVLTFSGFNYIAVGMRTLRNQIGVISIGAHIIEWSAFYGISNTIAMVVGNVLLSVSGTLLPTLSEEVSKGNRDNAIRTLNLALRLALVLNGFIALLILIGPKYILAIISNSYVEASDALRILVLAYIINSTSFLLSSLLNAINKARDIAFRESIASITIIVLTPILASIIGIEGAALALLIGSFINLVLTYLIIRRYGFSLAINTIKPVVSIALAFIIGYIILESSYNALIAFTIALALHAITSLAIKAITKKEINSILSIIVASTRRKVS